MSTTISTCIVCETQGAKVLRVGDSVRFECRRCGSFVLSGTAEQTLETRLSEKPLRRSLLRRSLMSHTLRRMQQADDKRLRVITDNDLPTFWRDERLPTPQKQADNLILWIGDNQETVFQPASIDRSRIAAWIGLPISARDDFDGWVWLHGEFRKAIPLRGPNSRGRYP
jgi:hypothetical protein